MSFISCKKVERQIPVKESKGLIFLFILFIVLAIGFILWYDAFNGSSTQTHSENAVWDLRGLTFDNSSYRLAGPVEYIPNALLTPREFAEREDEAVVGYPQDAAQYATSRMRILFPDDGYYAFSCRSIDYSERLYVNGQWVLDIGRPGETKETSVPNTGKISLTLKPENGVIEIVQQASIFVHREGGGHAGWNVGESGLIRSFITGDFHEIIQLGCFLALFFVHIILFLLLRSYRANLYFALFCLMWFLRTGVTGAKVFTELFPWISWVVKFRIEYLAFPITAVLLVSLLDVLFPGILHKWFRYVLYGVSVVIAALFLFSDTMFMSYALLWCEALYIPAILYIVVRFVMKLRAVNFGQGVFLAGVGLFFYATVHDMLYYNDIHIFPIGDLSSVSMLFLTFCEAAAVFIATVHEVKKAKAQELFFAVENAALKETARMTEQLLVLQRERYDKMTKNAESVRAQHHDYRHQLAAMKGYFSTGDIQGALKYYDEIAQIHPVYIDTIYCDNFAVNTVVAYYIDRAKHTEIETTVRTTIPAKAGQMQDSDLCVMIGNLLENAVEACERMEDGKRFIKLCVHIHYDNLTITVDNSFNGKIKEKDGKFYSSKREGEGVGLPSVRAMALKYGGNARFEIKDHVFLASVYVKMNDGNGDKMQNNAVNKVNSVTVADKV